MLTGLLLTEVLLPARSVAVPESVWLAPLAADGLIAGTGSDPRQRITTGPVDGDRAVVPAIGIGTGGSCATDGRSGQVDTDRTTVNRDAVSGEISGGTGERLVGSLAADGLIAGAGSDTGARGHRRDRDRYRSSGW